MNCLEYLVYITLGASLPLRGKQGVFSLKKLSLVSLYLAKRNIKALWFLQCIYIFDITGVYHLIQVLRKKHHYRIDPETYSAFTGTVYYVGKCRQEVCLNNKYHQQLIHFEFFTQWNWPKRQNDDDLTKFVCLYAVLQISFESPSRIFNVSLLVFIPALTGGKITLGFECFELL